MVKPTPQIDTTVKTTTTPLYHKGNYVQISIHYFTTLREMTGKKEEKLSFTEKQKPTTALALRILSDKYGKPFTDYVFDSNGKIKRFLQLLINGTNIITLDVQETLLQEGDVLAILPPVCGG
jgi:MoaD family protein